LAEGQQRAFKTNIASAEATIRQLREQVQKMKTTVQQIRAQCANDIRKRDAEMQRLKAHLTDRQRGKREGLGVTTININSAPERTPKSRSTPSGPDVNNPGYTLKQETTGFLTELCQNLSDENDSLISLARTTIQTLRELQGISASSDDDSSNLDASMSFLTGPQGPVDSLPTSVEGLSANMDGVLDHLRTLLTNPSFVPLEEVEIREEEIMRLREGWEKMEMRWKQAVTMMDGWQKRISDGGDSVNIDELRKGMSLDSGLGRSAAPSSADIDLDSDIFGDEDQLEDAGDMGDDHEPETRAKILKPTLSKPPIRALGERNGNVKSKSSPRKVSFHEEPMDSAPGEESEEEEAVLVKALASESVTQRSSRRRTSTKIPRQVRNLLQLHKSISSPFPGEPKATIVGQRKTERRRSRGTRRRGDRQSRQQKAKPILARSRAEEQVQRSSAKYADE
jgi:hypothetical protein